MANHASIVALEADPADAEDFAVSHDEIERALAERRARPGRPRGSTKEQVSLRIDRDVLERFRATGPGWQTRINEALRRVQP
jgi:uncharacterized protein (DUF4415 family)